MATCQTQKPPRTLIEGVFARKLMLPIAYSDVISVERYDVIIAACASNLKGFIFFRINRLNNAHVLPEQDDFIMRYGSDLRIKMNILFCSCESTHAHIGR